MKKFFEMAGLIAGLALFLGSLVVAEAYVSRNDLSQISALEETD